MGVPAEETIHEWIFGHVQRVCFDREYLYRSFVDHFAGFMKEVYEGGSVSGTGQYHIPGLKSGLQVILRWRLAHRVSYQGPNLLEVTAETRHDSGRREGAAMKAVFDLSTGASVTP